MAHIAEQIESIGRNCEFGFVQREAGVEAVSLLRWAGTPRTALIDGLRNGFVDLAEEMTGFGSPPNKPPEEQFWWLTCKRYGILFHTGERVSQKTVATACEAVRKRLRWLAQKLISDIKSDEKLFVFSDATIADPNDALDLLDAMRNIGPAWLWVVAQSDCPDGTVALRRGMIGSSTRKLTRPNDAVGYAREAWPEMMRQAYAFWSRRLI